MTLAQVAESRREPALQEGSERADVHRARLAILLEAMQRRFELIEPATHAGQQLQAFRSELDLAAVAPEERGAQVILEGLDLLADGGRRDAQRLGGLAET